MRYEIGQVLKKEDVMQLVNGHCPNPKKLLGRHLVPGGQVIAAYHPRAARMRLEVPGGSVYEMEMIERQPVFAVFLPNQDLFHYQIEIFLRSGNTIRNYDPYSFPVRITEEEENEYLHGRWMNAYRKMGCHPVEMDGVRGMYFAVWAPNAKRVSLVGDFNQWDGKLCPMNRMQRSDIFEIFVPGLPEGTHYQYETETVQGDILRVADPYGTVREPGDISKVLNPKKFLWKDDQWMKKQRKVRSEDRPLILCALPDGGTVRLDDFPENICTHILFRGHRGEPKTVHSAYADVGYFFVPPGCGENPDDFRTFVQDAHRRGIGVLMEISFHMVSSEKPQILDFILSNLRFWMEEYHIDGFAFDEIDVSGCSWNDIFNDIDIKEREREEKYSVERRNRRLLLRRAVDTILKDNPGLIVIFDETVSHRRQMEARYPEEVPLGFYWNYSIKSNLDRYLESKDADRTAEHYRLTLPLQQTGSKRGLQFLSYKNMDRLCQTSIDKSAEVYYHMLSEAKLTFAFLTGVPGKKVLPDRLKDPYIQRYLRELLMLYRTWPALHERGDGTGFAWVNGMDAPSSVVSFVRSSSLDENRFLFICNFNSRSLEEYPVGVSGPGEYRLLLNSDGTEFGGMGRFAHQHPAVIRRSCDFKPYSMTVCLPPESVLIFGFGPAFCGG